MVDVGDQVRGRLDADGQLDKAGAVSEAHGARRSQVDSTPPKLVAGTMSAEFLTTVSAAFAVSSSNDSSGPKPRRICLVAASNADPVSSPG
jgi:hypothetical protein